MQLDLFGNIVIANEGASVASKVNWSYSKMQIFRDCPRKYYYMYYGSKKRNAKDEPLKMELIELSKLSNKYMVQGNLIHQMIGLYFNKAKKNDFWDYGKTSNFAKMILNETIEYNNSVKKGISVDNTKYPKALLKELLVKDVDSIKLKDEMLSTIDQCIKIFFESDVYKEVRLGGISYDSLVEGDTSFTLTESINVDGKVDLAFLSDKTLNITDWKTGKKGVEDTSLQLLVYALWAKKINHWKFDTVEIKKAYLASCELEKLEFSDVNVERAKVRIMQDAEILNEMNDYGKMAEGSAFTMHKGKNCLQCPYEKICYK